ncbi:MAG: prefoldin subunit, partial [Candidatus Aenigmatarchaeota archaeon]
QQQLQMVESQKEALNMQVMETGKALDELSKPGEGDVYKITGPILVKVSRDEAKKDVEGKKELAMLRLRTMEKSEAGIKGKLEELKGKLEKAGI